MKYGARLASNPSRRGSAVALALVVVTVVAGFAVAFLRISTSSTARQTNEVENLRAFYLAEAGLAESFQALRIGRTGQVGSETEPAAYGQGLLWVDAIDTTDGQVRLESTALVGRGRATLALIVEPIRIPLGFFSDETLVIHTVLLTDGYDSEISTYVEQVISNEITVDLNYPFLHDDWKNSLLFFEGHFYHYTAKSGYTYIFDHDGSPATTPEIDYKFTDGVEWPGLIRWQDAFRSSEYDIVLAHFAALLNAEPPAEAIGPTTGANALLSSNADVTFLAPDSGQAQIFGDVMPGPGGSVIGIDSVTISGETASRPETVELQEVVIPDVAMGGPVLHDGLLPLTITPGDSGYERIEVAPDAELILRGPSTIVLGELVVREGATLTLDTRDGDVALYVTGGMDLQPGSITTTTGDFPDEISVQVAAIPTGPDGPPIKLDSTAQFHGTIYSPQTDVYVGSNFETYGGIVAKKLTIGPGARLHFDEAGFENTPIPKFVSWKIVEIKSAAKNRTRNLFKALGIDPLEVRPLAKAHDLEKVQLQVEYLNKSGIKQSYVGPESAFDWDSVKEVTKVSREAAREKRQVDDSAPIEPVAAPPIAPTNVRQDLYDELVAYDGTDSVLVDKIFDSMPLTTEEMTLVEALDPPLPQAKLNSITVEDSGNKGPGGGKP